MKKTKIQKYTTPALKHAITLRKAETTQSLRMVGIFQKLSPRIKFQHFFCK